MIIFKSFEDTCIKFSSEEQIEDLKVQVEGCYSLSDDSFEFLYESDEFKAISPSDTCFVANSNFLGYPILKLIFKKYNPDEEDISEVLVPANSINNNQWSLSNYYTNSELKEINKGDITSFIEIFMEGAYGRPDQIPNVNTIVDLGFNCGWFGLFSADKAQKYIAVEADERLNSIGLTVNKKNRDKIHICNKAFHNTNNQDIAFYLNNMQSSSGSNIWSAERGRDKFGDMKPERKPTVKKTINLPEIMRSYNIDYIDLLKVDVEGAEEFLLEKPNLEIVLNKVGILLLELHSSVPSQEFDRTSSADSIEMFENNIEMKNRFDEDIIAEDGPIRMIRLTKKPELRILESINSENMRL